MKTDLYKYATEPFAHQIEAEKFLAEHPCGALFMEQGTGKTKTSIDFAGNLFLAKQINRVMVIAPNGVHRQWAISEIPLHGSFVPFTTHVWHSGSKGKKLYQQWLDTITPATLNYFCVNVEAFSISTYISLFKQFVAGGDTLVILDEATSIKNPTANRTANITAGLSDVVKVGRRIVSCTPRSKFRLILTGTPEAKGPYGLWSMLNFVQPNFFGMNYYAFRARYGMEKQVTFPGVIRPVRKSLEPEDFRNIRSKHLTGERPEDIAGDLGISLADVQYIIDNPDVNTPYKNLTELRDKVNSIAFTVTKDQCLDLPSKVYEQRVVPMSDEQRKLYSDIKKYAWAVYEKGALDATNKVAIQTRLRQIAGGFFPTKYDLSEGVEQELTDIVNQPIGTPPKVTAVQEMLEDNAKFPVIISTAFTAEADYLFALLSKKYTCGIITGKVPKKERIATESAFKAGTLQVLIATEGAIAKGYNFQQSSTMYLYSCTFNTEDRMQLEDRIHRIGQKEHAVYVDLITEHSVDESVLKVLRGDRTFQEYMRSSSPEDFFKLIGE